jgi:hypothetical protein
MNENLDPVYIYLHIPRTGGTTLTWSIGYQFHREDDRWLRHFNWMNAQDYIHHNIPLLERRTVEQHKQLKFITGHSTFNMCHYWLKVRKNPHVFTTVRDPIDRLISSFNYRHGTSVLNQDPGQFTLTSPLMDPHARFNSKTADDYTSMLDWYRDAGGEHNLQCKWLLKSYYVFLDNNFVPFDQIVKHKDPTVPDIWPAWFDDIEIDDYLFGMVLDIVDNQLWYAGLNETLSEDITALCEYTGVNQVDVNNRHRSGDDYPVYWTREQVEQQPDYARLVDCEKYDIMLYEHIKENSKRPF